MHISVDSTLPCAIPISIHQTSTDNIRDLARPETAHLAFHDHKTSLVVHQFPNLHWHPQRRIRIGSFGFESRVLPDQTTGQIGNEPQSKDPVLGLQHLIRRISSDFN